MRVFNFQRYHFQGIGRYAPWAAYEVLHIYSDRELDRARQAFESHLARAKWMTKDGYRHLLRRGLLYR